MEEENLAHMSDRILTASARNTKIALVFFFLKYWNMVNYINKKVLT